MFLFFVTFCLTSAKVVGFRIREKKRGCFSMEVVATAGYIRDKGGEKLWNLSQLLFLSLLRNQMKHAVCGNFALFK
jgi:hypothetical protein